MNIVNWNGFLVSQASLSVAGSDGNSADGTITRPRSPRPSGKQSNFFMERLQGPVVHGHQVSKVTFLWNDYKAP